MIKWFKAWIVPGAVFQSVIVGGGYGTGREVVEYVSSAGPWGGLANTVLIGLLFGLVLAVTFDYARRFEVRDYRLFIKSLLGPGWMLYEAVMIVAFVLVLAVAGSAAGQVLHDSFGVPFAAGVGLMLLIVVTLNYSGRQWIERTLTAWGLLMSLMLIVYTILVFLHMGEAIAGAFTGIELESGWWRSGVRFFLYTAMIIPVLLYATDHIETRTQAWGAGLIAGVLGTLPAVLYHLTFMAGYPQILEEALPTYWTILRVAVPGAVVVYVIVLFVTIAQTGVGILQGINERLDAWWLERRGHALTPRLHASIAGGAVLASLLLSNFGIVALVAQGYGTLAWFGIFLFVAPLLTIGAWRLYGAR